MKKLFSLRIALLIATVLSALIGCNDSGLKPKEKIDQPDLTVEEQKRLILLDTNYVYSLDAAKQDGAAVAAELDTEDAKKGIKVIRSISEVKTYSILDTVLYPGAINRKNDPGIYVFNFSNDNGFAIISGDERIMGRLGWSGKGKLDNNPNPGVRVFLSRMIPYFQFKRKEVEAMRGDSTHISLLKKLSKFKKQENNAASNGRVAQPCYQLRAGRTAVCADGGCDKYTYSYQLSSTNTTNTVVPQILKTQWGQGPPYNNNFDNECAYQSSCSGYGNSNYSAGCVNVSEAQVVAHYYGIYNRANDTDWQVIANTSSACSLNPTQVDKVAWLIKDIFNQYPTYQTCGSGTATWNAAFYQTSDRGISARYELVQGEWRDYNVGDLRNSIFNGSPVPVLASQHEWCVFFNFGCGPDLTTMHQWILDGILTTNQISTYAVFPVDYYNCAYLPSYTYTTNSVVNTYTHSNWGWAGYQDGWYLESAFGDWDITHTYNVYSFNHNDKIIAYVTKHP
ncbi:MAG: C10 family peptidase [Cyclobacteriaceae bacterium]